MGLINAFIDCLDKKWGEQAMQRTLDEQDRAIEEKESMLKAGGYDRELSFFLRATRFAPEEKDHDSIET